MYQNVKVYVKTPGVLIEKTAQKGDTSFLGHPQSNAGALKQVGNSSDRLKTFNSITCNAILIVEQDGGAKTGSDGKVMTE